MPPEGVLACADDLDCPARWVCAAARCFRSVGDDTGPRAPEDGGRDAGERVDGGRLDAATDAGPPTGDDAATDAGDAGCSGISCDDGVACTIDTCGSGASCTFTPDDTACAPGETCDPTDGCECLAVPCRLVAPQCGCPAGQACYPTVDLSEGTCAVAGTGGEGAACISHLDCGTGLACAPFPAGPGGQCKRLCDTDEDCPGATSRCTVPLGEGSMVCSLICTPGQACSVGGTVCVIRELFGPGPAHTDCVRTRVGPARCSACGTDDCEAGLLCSDSQCRYPCLDGIGCAEREVCVGLAGPPMLGGLEVGVCVCLP